ncbi:MAG: prepilin peptidase [Tepidiformaceae bacterium]
MDIAFMVLAALVAGALGWLGGANQHRLYRQEENRESPATGRAAWAIRAGCAVGAGLVAAVAFRPDHYEFGPALATAGFGLALVVLSSTDFERRLLPNNLMHPAIISAVLLCWVWPDRSIADVLVGGAVAAGVGVALFMLGIITGAALGVRATAFGLGDSKLILLIGLLVGWPAIINALFIGILAAGVPSVFMMLRGKGKSVFSYGPYLAVGGLVVLLWPERFM